MRTAALLCGLVLALGATPARSQALLRSEVPAPAGRTNHAPGLVETAPGRLLLCWYSGTAEAHPDTRILCSDSADNGIAWTPPRVAVRPGDRAAGAREPNKSLGNVVLFAESPARIWMIHGVIQRWDTAVGNLCRTWRCGRVDARLSVDGGHSWGLATRLDDTVGALPRAPPLAHPALGLLLPLYLEAEQRSYVRAVTIEGDRLHAGPAMPVPGIGAIQPALTLQADGGVRAFLRDSHARSVQVAVLDPATRRWGEAAPTNLPNPDSAVAALTDDAGRFVLIYNPSHRNRRTLRLAASRDGVAFAPGCDLVPEAAEGDVAYPTVIRARDGMWHVAYSSGGKHGIRHAAFGAAWLRGCV